MSDFLKFFQEQVLSMKFLNELIGQVLLKAGVDTSSKLGGAVQFFLYDTIKIFILLVSMIFIISYIQSYFPPERSRQILGKYKGILSYTIAALLGTVTPFCSCSSIPLFIGFISAGLPLGVVFAFLISSPLVDLGSIVLLSSMFGFKITFVYVVLGLILAVIGGALITNFLVCISMFMDTPEDERTKLISCLGAFRQFWSSLSQVNTCIYISRDK